MARPTVGVCGKRDKPVLAMSPLFQGIGPGVHNYLGGYGHCERQLDGVVFRGSSY